jgi:hypothetical protein
MGKATNRNRKAKMQVANTGTSEPPADRVAIEARARVHGLTPEEAKDPLTATPHGRLFKRRQISEYQYNALEKMIALCGQHSQALSTPNRPNLPREAFTGGSDRESLDRWANAIIEAYDDAKAAVNDYSRRMRMALWTNFELACLDNGSKYQPRMDLELSVCANILADHFGIAKMDKAA